MRRAGHHRPVGTVTAPWRLTWNDWDREPQLGDFVAETIAPGGDPDELERAYLLVGLEEPARGRTWKLTFERLAWPPDRIDWCFWRERR